MVKIRRNEGGRDIVRIRKKGGRGRDKMRRKGSVIGGGKPSMTWSR